jgi:hypothetical protein
MASSLRWLQCLKILCCLALPKGWEWGVGAAASSGAWGLQVAGDGWVGVVGSPSNHYCRRLWIRRLYNDHRSSLSCTQIFAGHAAGHTAGQPGHTFSLGLLEGFGVLPDAAHRESRRLHISPHSLQSGSCQSNTVECMSATIAITVPVMCCGTVKQQNEQNSKRLHLTSPVGSLTLSATYMLTVRQHLCLCTDELQNKRPMNLAFQMEGSSQA